MSLWQSLTSRLNFGGSVGRNVFHFLALRLRPFFLAITNTLNTTLLHANTSSSNTDPALMPLPHESKDDESRARHLVHLKTKEECRLGTETIEVWTVELPSKHAEGVLKIIKENIDGQEAIDLQHLRRFAKPKYLPPHVLGQRNLAKEMYSVPRAWENAAPTVIQTPTAHWDWATPHAPGYRHNNRPLTLYLLICPTRLCSLEDLAKLLMQHVPFCSSADSWAYPLDLKCVTVPLLPPTSAKQAIAWSDTYWPTFYRKTNPFGAHPAAIYKAEADLLNPASLNVPQALQLASDAAAQTRAKRLGPLTGCVILERDPDTNATSIIAVAGDARYSPLPGGDPTVGSCSGTGNPMGHAVMRAIGMVGRKRLRVATPLVKQDAAKRESNFSAVGLDHNEPARDAFFLDLPLTPLEQHHAAVDNIKADGYLCLKLEVFLTHEPCLMCSMALVHSRVGRVIFRDRMPKTGGLTAELVSNEASGSIGLGYGLCWRKELNWQFMCWEYTATPPQPDEVAQDANGGEITTIVPSSSPPPRLIETIVNTVAPIFARKTKKKKKFAEAPRIEDETTATIAVAVDDVAAVVECEKTLATTLADEHFLSAFSLPTCHV